MAALENGKDESLPPLMNPSILEASDDLTNLSHLNEPAGMSLVLPQTVPALMCVALIVAFLQFSRLSDFATCKKRYTHTPVSC